MKPILRTGAIIAMGCFGLTGVPGRQSLEKHGIRQFPRDCRFFRLVQLLEASASRFAGLSDYAAGSPGSLLYEIQSQYSRLVRLPSITRG